MIGNLCPVRTANRPTPTHFAFQAFFLSNRQYKTRKEIDLDKVKCTELRTLRIWMKVIDTQTKAFVTKIMKVDLGK